MRLYYYSLWTATWILAAILLSFRSLYSPTFLLYFVTFRKFLSLPFIWITRFDCFYSNIDSLGVSHRSHILPFSIGAGNWDRTHNSQMVICKDIWLNVWIVSVLCLIIIRLAIVQRLTTSFTFFFFEGKINK